MKRLILILVALAGCGTDEPTLCRDGNTRCDQRCLVAEAEGPSSEAAGEPIGGECDGVAIDGSELHCTQRVDFGDGNIGCCSDGGWFACVEGE